MDLYGEKIYMYIMIFCLCSWSSKGTKKLLKLPLLFVTLLWQLHVLDNKKTNFQTQRQVSHMLASQQMVSNRTVTVTVILLAIISVCLGPKKYSISLFVPRVANKQRMTKKTINILLKFLFKFNIALSLNKLPLAKF